MSQATYFSESQEINFPSLTDQLFGLTEDSGEWGFFQTVSDEDADVVLGEMSCQKVHYQLLLTSNVSGLPGLDTASAQHYHIIPPPSY